MYASNLRIEMWMHHHCCGKYLLVLYCKTFVWALGCFTAAGESCRYFTGGEQIWKQERAVDEKLK